MCAVVETQIYTNNTMAGNCVRMVKLLHGLLSFQSISLLFALSVRLIFPLSQSAGAVTIECFSFLYEKVYG